MLVRIKRIGAWLSVCLLLGFFSVKHIYSSALKHAKMEVVVTAADQGMRVNVFARRSFGWSKSAAKRCFKAAMVRVNDVAVEETRQLCAGDVIAVVNFGSDEGGEKGTSSEIIAVGSDVAPSPFAIKALPTVIVPPPNAAILAQIEVCFEDAHLAVVWKPFGLSSVQTGRCGEVSVEAALPFIIAPALPGVALPPSPPHLKRSEDAGGCARLLLGPLMLEKWVAGFLVVAKTAAAWDGLETQLFREEAIAARGGRGDAVVATLSSPSIAPSINVPSNKVTQCSGGVDGGGAAIASPFPAPLGVAPLSPIRLEFAVLLHGKVSPPALVGPSEVSVQERAGEGRTAHRIQRCEVLQRARGTHARGSHFTLVNAALAVCQLKYRTSLKALNRVALSVLQLCQAAGHPVVGSTAGGIRRGGGGSSEKARRELTAVASGNGTVRHGASDGGATAASSAPRQGGGRRGRSTCVALCAISFPHPVTGAPCSVRHEQPARFRAIILREEGQWAKRRAKIAALRAHSGAKRNVPLSDEEGEDGGECEPALPPMPPAYVTGCTRFAGLTFQISRAVMVPRTSTERLVQAAIVQLAATAAMASAAPQQLRVLDLGTGPGNVLLAILHHTSASLTCTGVGLDISDDALDLARSNAAVLGYDDCTRFQTGNFAQLHDLPACFWDDACAGCAQQRPSLFDLVVCNPPYLCAELETELGCVAPSLQHEPARALFAPAGGTAAYTDIVRSIARCSPPLLISGGSMLFEVGAGCASAVIAAITGLNIAGCCCRMLTAADLTDGATISHQLGDLDLGTNTGQVLSVTLNRHTLSV